MINVIVYLKLGPPPLFSPDPLEEKCVQFSDYRQYWIVVVRNISRNLKI